MKHGLRQVRHQTLLRLRGPDCWAIPYEGENEGLGAWFLYHIWSELLSKRLSNNVSDVHMFSSGLRVCDSCNGRVLSRCQKGSFFLWHFHCGRIHWMFLCSFKYWKFVPFLFHAVFRSILRDASFFRGLRSHIPSVVSCEARVARLDHCFWGGILMVFSSFRQGSAA